MKKFFQEFKDFAMRGNVVDMAVGVIIGGAFGKIVTSLVNDVIMPLVGLLTGGTSFTDCKWVIREASEDAKQVAITYGQFIQTVVDFLIVAFCIFLAIKVMNRLSRKEQPKEEPAPAAPAGPTQEELLAEIRDLLKAQKK